MGIYLNPSNEMFAESIRSEIYVDKTGLIEYMNDAIGTRQKFICVSRPRRFGKSMAAEMMAAYYNYADNSRELFDGLEISKSASFEKHLNKYDVIFLNMQGFLSWAGNVSEVSDYVQKEVMSELRKLYGENIPLENERLRNSLATVFAETGRKFIFIIDEWDCVFREKSHDKEGQTKYLDFLRDLFKDQPYVGLVYMTGILPIKKYGTHSALNMFREFSMTEPRRLAKFIGFTEEEVKALCEKYNMDFEETKRWYDGYCFPREKHIYSPKSVVDAMLDGEFGNYWTRTETYEALKVYIEMNYDGLKDAIVQMLAGAGHKVNTNRFQNDMTTFESKDDVLTLLIHLGYLAYDVDKKEAYIPNYEVREEFVNAIEGARWDETVRAITASEELLEAVLSGDEDAVAKGIDTVHMDTTSILSYNNENSLSCVISLALYSARNYYTLIRELPTGKGFADMAYLPRKNCDKPAMLVELKWDTSADSAIKQIKDKKYTNAFSDYSGEIILVGINYDKDTKEHGCKIERVVK